MAPKLSGIDHVHVYVSDRDEAESWYLDVLGFRSAEAFRVWATPEGPLVMENPEGTVHLALFERKSHPDTSAIAFGASGAEFECPPAERFARAPWLAWFYVQKLLAPHGLMFFYPRWSVDPHSWSSYIPHIVLGGLLLAAWIKRHTWGRTALLGLGYYLLCLGPVLGFLDLFYHRTSFVADHWQYLASVGLIGLAAYLREERQVVEWSWRFGPAENSTRHGRVAYVTGVLCILGAGVWLLMPVA